MNVGEVGYLLREWVFRVHEREPFDYLAPLHTSRGYLRQLVVVEREARRLGVQYDDVDQDRRNRSKRRFRERGVPPLDGLRCAVAYETTMQDTVRLLAVLFHNDQPPSLLFAQTKHPRRISISISNSPHATPLPFVRSPLFSNIPHFANDLVYFLSQFPLYFSISARDVS